MSGRIKPQRDDGGNLRGTTNPPKRIHMEAMREPKASMNPMKSHTRAPADRDKRVGQKMIPFTVALLSQMQG